MQSLKRQKCKFHLSHIEASTNEHNMFHLEPFDRRLLRPERKLASPSLSPPFRPPGCCFRLTKYAIGRNSALFHPGWPIGPWFNQATEPYQTISKQIEPYCAILNRSPPIEEWEDDTLWQDMTRCATSQGITPFVWVFMTFPWPSRAASDKPSPASAWGVKNVNYIFRSLKCSFDIPAKTRHV